MPNEVNLKQLNEDYPCDMRNGHGKGCKCKNNGIDTSLITCKYYRGNVRIHQCYACRYQKKYMQNINKSTE